MRVLLTTALCAERETSLYRTISIQRDLPLKELIWQQESGSDIEVALFISQYQHEYLRSYLKREEYQLIEKYIIECSNKDLYEAMHNGIQVLQGMYLDENYSNPKVINLYKKYLEKFNPDIIMSYEYPVPNLKEHFPNTLVLNILQNPVLRSICPLKNSRRLYLDHTSLLNPLISRYKHEIDSYSFPQEDIDEISNLKEAYQKYLSASIKRKEATQEEIDQINLLKSKYNKTYFLPLQGPHFNFSYAYDSQIAYITSVVEKVDKDILLLIRNHPLCPEISDLDQKIIEKTYPNCKFIGHSLNTVLIISLLDGCIAFSSFLKHISSILGKESIIVKYDNGEISLKNEQSSINQLIFLLCYQSLDPYKDDYSENILEKINTLYNSHINNSLDFTSYITNNKNRQMSNFVNNNVYTKKKKNNKNKNIQNKKIIHTKFMYKLRTKHMARF